MPVKRFRKADKGMRACADSFLAHRPLLARLVASIVRPHEIEDIVQETFARSCAAARKNAIRNPRAFMLRTAKNIALNSVKRADRKLTCSMEEFLESEVFVQAETPESEYESHQEFLIFCQAVANLPAKCRRVFILKKIYGLSQKDIAAQLGISESAVEKHISRGIAATARCMLDSGYSLGDPERALAGRAPGSTDEVQDS